MSNNPIQDLIDMVKRGDANIQMLLETAYNRGIQMGIHVAKEKMRECIDEEKKSNKT